jgi:DNA polymerase-3 subunit delta'
MYPWIEQGFEKYKAIKNSKRLGHALLLTAPKGIGVEELASSISKDFLCMSPSGYHEDCNCSSCEMFRNNSHPDILTVQRTSHVITVDSLRNSITFLEESSSNGRGKVLLINDAELMNVQASNALLKTLEEPPKDSLIILATYSASLLLPTIISRTVRLSINMPSFVELNHELCQRFDKNEDYRVELIVTGRSLVDAIELIESKKNELIKEAINIFSLVIARRESPTKFVQHLLQEIKDDELIYGLMFAIIKEAMQIHFVSDGDSYVLFKEYPHVLQHLGKISPDSLGKAQTKLVALKGVYGQKTSPIQNLQLLSWIELIVNI